MMKQRSRGAFFRSVMTGALIFGISGCAAVKKAPGLNMLFPTDEPQLGLDPTAGAGVDYSVDVSGLGVAETPGETAENARMQGIIESAARIYKLQDKPPPNIALLKRRAASDVKIVERALKSEGYYEGEATIKVTGTDEAPVVDVDVRKGPRYALARQQITFDTPVSPAIEQIARDAASINVGGPAQGRAVVDAEREVVRILNRSGWPYNEKGKRRAEANFDENTLDVRTPYTPGPYTTYGPVVIEGLSTVEQRYVETFISWKPGDPVSNEQIAKVQRELSATRLFDTVAITLPDEPPEGWETTGRFEAPVKITFEESKHRKIKLALNYSTTDGPGGIVDWEHRNLYGQNETLRALANISLEEQSARLDYRKPRYMKPERDLIAGIELFHEDRDAFEAFGVDGLVGLEERFSEHLTGTLGVGFEAAQIRESGTRKDSFLIGLPGTLQFDDTDDLLNPTEGFRASAEVTPWAGAFDEQPVGFVQTDFEGSTYLALDYDANYILALRARVAAVLTDDADNVPANRRVYSGGGGSVRGYRTQHVNDLDANGDPIGALSAYELSAEMRIRFGSFGVVPFVDAGAVANEFFQDFSELRWGGGLGLRYFSPVGPIRVDLAVPFNKRREDDSYQLYLSIGQAF